MNPERAITTGKLRAGYTGFFRAYAFSSGWDLQKYDGCSYRKSGHLLTISLRTIPKLTGIPVENMPSDNDNHKVNNILSPLVITMHIPTPEELRATPGGTRYETDRTCKARRHQPVNGRTD